MIGELGLTSRVIDAQGAKLHFVEKGNGPLLVLVSGWPQTWLAWRKVIPRLADTFRVLAIDPPGLGDSGPSVSGYDTRAIALHLDALFAYTGDTQCRLVGHDVGSWISYAYAAQRPERVTHLALIDAAVPGLAPDDIYRLTPQTLEKTWHFAFNFLPELSELLVTGREREFLAWLFRTKSVDWNIAFDDRTIDEYASAYARPGRWTAGLAYYRSIFESIAQNKVSSRIPLPMPVLAIGGDFGVGENMHRSIVGAALDVRGTVIANCGHYVPEEKPSELIDAMLPFLSER
ncbi:alpha/beta fold hydrolase [Bradyrhizobium mercantei]|uniref:alpha/beta fold hydrolase n=1 Tax=Bradyrhizobium mercantei TaxID=1904807 RepID=UPI0009781B11|nr:alpha/beta hydrolase [Bradyrhizobium mercantei]